MTLKTRTKFSAIAECLASMFSGQVFASSKVDIAAQANNPLDNMTAFNLHNYCIGEQLAETA
jgi:hypothetical protein